MAEIYVTLADLAKGEDDPAAALEYYTLARQMSPRSLEAVAKSASLLMDAGRRQEALDLLQSSKDAIATDPEMLDLTARLQEEARSRECVRTLRALQALSPERAGLFMRLVNAELEWGETRCAHKLLLDLPPSRRANDEYADAFDELVRRELSERKVKEAEQALNGLGDSILPAAPAPEENDGVVYAGGRWVSPSMRDMLLRQASALNYRPRPVDLTGFVAWLKEREFAFLRAHALAVGQGKDAAAEALGLADLHSRAHRTGLASAVETARVYQALFLPGEPESDRTTILRWSMGRRAGAPEISFILLRNPSDWPAVDVTLAAAPDAGVDLGAVAARMAADQALSARPICLFFRVRNCVRSVDGRGADTWLRMRLEVEVLAVALSTSGTPEHAWISGAEALSQR